MTEEEAAYYEANRQVRAYKGHTRSPEWRRLLDAAQQAEWRWLAKKRQMESPPPASLPEE
ncbi:hypothetical protein [Microvirga zambiensis]|uniref:hypothetical protein n=1 Tax=Microvirga zambiensis TaxID=1402137 RepID=UPI00191EC82E|nr:hypothetical protein [Microvirga zambiensis]